MGGGIETGQQSEERRFPATGRSDNGDIGAVRNVERDAIECRQQRLTTMVLLGQVAGGEHSLMYRVMERRSGRTRMERRGRQQSPWKPIAAMFVAGAIAVACGGGTRAGAHDSQTTSGDTATPPAAAHTVLIVGTSFTAGLGLDPDESWPALLQQRIDSAGLPFTVRNAGLSGETSAGALRRMDWLLRGPVDVFVLETGANDGLRGLDPDSLRANIEAAIGKVKRERPNARICVVPDGGASKHGTVVHARIP